jgi:hypothetical protein
MHKHWIIFLLLFSEVSYSLTQNLQDGGAATPALPVIVRYPDPPALHSIQIYKFELIHRALEITRKEFGDYKEIPYTGAGGGQQRWAKLINKADLLNVVWSSPGTPVAKAEVISIPIDILRGQLGYRVCLINSNSPFKLDDAFNTGSLASLKLAQEESWSDVEIYRNNNIEPMLGPNFLSLFDMLGFKRFDCLPLGVDEVDLIYNEKKARYPFLSIDTRLLIYYDFPLYLYVSKTQPLLAERLQIGLTKMQKNGEFDQLFKQYHPQDISSLNLRSRRVICLKSPFLDQSTQCTQSLKYPEIN